MNRDYERAIASQISTLAIARRIARERDGIYSDIAVVQAIALEHAAPFFWGREAAAAVRVAAASVPSDTRLTTWNLPTDAAWWWFEDPAMSGWTIDGDTGERCEAPIRALSMLWAAGMFRITPWSDSNLVPGELYPCGVLNWPEGLTVESMATAKGVDLRNGELKRAQAMPADSTTPAFVIAALAWLEQRVLTTTPAGIHRARRRELERATGQANGDVRVVQLRRAEAREGDAVSGEGHYACRWTVGGHWRQQPCGPARAERRLTWVHPYLKGPDGMPFREPRVRMYAVTR